MSNANVVQSFLSQFGKISTASFVEINKLCQFKSLEKGAFFIETGSVKTEIALLIKGCMRYFYLKDGEEITGEFWQENEIAAAYECCILNQPSSLYIEAIEPSEIISIDYVQLKKVANSSNGLDKVIIALLENFIVESQERVASFIIETPEERYLRLRKEMPGIEERVHQKYIASFVGVTPVTLSRIRSRLAKNSG